MYNRFNEEQPYCCNMFLNCIYCYRIREYETFADFIKIIRESDYPFNKSRITAKGLLKKHLYKIYYEFEICSTYF